VRPPIVAVSGRSGSGKTRLLARLIPALARRGVEVAVLKHTRHRHPFDRPGKDTDVLRRAGAVATAIEGPAGMALFAPPAGGLRALARFLPPVDLVLAEGFHGEPVPRIEVHRRSVSSIFLCASDRRVFAIVTDEPPPRPIRAFTARDAEAIADLVCSRFGLGARRGGSIRLRVRPAVSTVRADHSERMVALGRSNRMAKTNRKGGARTSGRSTRRSGSRSTGSRSTGGRSAAGRKGGNATLRNRGPEFYSEIGRKGGRSRSRKAGRAASTTRRKTGGRRSSSTARGGSRSRGRGGSRSMRRSGR
jgi:molybdopterin-guanine dinucleotide biosynthesis protein B